MSHCILLSHRHFNTKIWTEKPRDQAGADASPFLCSPGSNWGPRGELVPWVPERGQQPPERGPRLCAGHRALAPPLGPADGPGLPGGLLLRGPQWACRQCQVLLSVPPECWWNNVTDWPMTPSNCCAEGQWLSAEPALGPGLSVRVTPHSVASVVRAGPLVLGAQSPPSGPQACCGDRACSEAWPQARRTPECCQLSPTALLAPCQGPCSKGALGGGPHCLWCPGTCSQDRGTRLHTGELLVPPCNQQLSARHRHRTGTSGRLALRPVISKGVSSNSPLVAQGPCRMGGWWAPGRAGAVTGELVPSWPVGLLPALRALPPHVPPTPSQDSKGTGQGGCTPELAPVFGGRNPGPP